MFHSPRAQTPDAGLLLRRAIEWWPHILILVSVTGLAYVALKAVM